MAADDQRRILVLRDLRDADGTRYLEAHLTADGWLQISGQDLGAGVEAVFGPGLREYEWWWAIPGDALADAMVALGGVPGEDPLDVLQRWAVANPGGDPGSTLRDAGVPVEFDARVGD